MIPLILILLVLLPASGPKAFTCDREPFAGQPERQCGPRPDAAPASVFHPDHAHCFHHSMSRLDAAIASGQTLPLDWSKVPGTGYWSDERTLPACFPTLEECRSYRDAVGTGRAGQPPTKTACVLTTPDEDPTAR